MKIKKPNKIVENVEIIDTSSEGKAVARVDDLVVFVDGAVPGDICTIMISRIKKKFAEAKLMKLEKASPKRIEAVCKHFGSCGGCKWQHLDYETQLYYKQKHVHDSLTRLAKVDFPELKPILGASNFYNYRNKLEFTFSAKKWLTKETENVLLSDLGKEEKTKILREVIRTERFEQFLHKRFPGAKRFSIEGGDSSICAIEQMISTSASQKVKKIIILTKKKVTIIIIFMKK